MSDENRVFNPVQLQEKNIEPATKNQDFLNRNFQLGKIDSLTLKRLAYEMARAIDFDDFPYEKGGFLTAQYGDEKKRKIEALMVMSGSRDGFVRESNNTIQSNQKLEQSQKGALSGMFSKN